MITQRDGRVIAGISGYGFEFVVILEMDRWAEESILVLQVVRKIKSGFDRHAVDVPFAGVISAIVSIAKQTADQGRPIGPLTRGARNGKGARRPVTSPDWN